MKPNVRKLLSKLNPKTHAFGSGGGVPGLGVSWSDLVMALPADPLQRALVQVKWAGREGRRGDLVEMFLSRVMETKRWRVRLGKTLANLAAMAVDEYVSEAVCPICHGQRPLDGELTGTRDEGGVWRCPCKACKGTGRPLLPSAKVRARYIGVSPSSWSEVWQHRYEELLSLLGEIEQQAVINMERALR